LSYSCKRKAINVSSEYIGEWRTEHDIHDAYTIISIDGDGKAHYTEYGPAADEDFEKIARIKNNTLCLGAKKHFNIDQEPTQNYDTTCLWGVSGVVCIVYSSTMKLDNRSYYRVEEVY
jgi:hypothetical protein